CLLHITQRPSPFPEDGHSAFTGCPTPVLNGLPCMSAGWGRAGCVPSRRRRRREGVCPRQLLIPSRSFLARRPQARRGADRVQVRGAPRPPVLGARLGLVRVPGAVLAEAELSVTVGVGEPVAPGTERWEVRGQQQGAGPVEAARRRVPGLLEYGESLAS